FRELTGVPIEGPPPPVEESPADVGQRAYGLFMLGKLDEALPLQAGLTDATIVLMDYKEAGWIPVVPEEYVTSAENELRAHPDDLGRLRGALAANELAGRVDRALELCRRWLEDRPDDVDQLTVASHLARRQGDAEAARGYVDRAVRAEPDNAN